MRVAVTICLFIGVAWTGKVSAEDVSPARILDSRLKKIPEVRKISCFWDAIAVADGFCIVKSDNSAKELKIIETVPAGLKASGIKFPAWSVWQMRKPGEYIIPLVKQGSSTVIPGRNYTVPGLNKLKPAQLDQLFKQYRALKKDQEQSFLKGVLTNKGYTALHYPCLKRFLALGEFKKPLSKYEKKFWNQMYFDKDSSIPFKRSLLRHLSVCNFLPDSGIFLHALKEPTMHELAAVIYIKEDKKSFESLMLKWLNDPELRRYAIMNSDKVVGNPAYAASAMKYFDPKDKKNLQYFIPVLCVTSDKAGEKFIRNFLITDRNPRNFELYRKLFKTLSKYKPDTFTEELKTFLKNNRKNIFIKKSSIYPMILVCLCRAKDVDGYKMTLEYLSSLPSGSKNVNDVMKIKMVLRIFRAYNPTINKLDKLKQDIKQKLKSANKLSQSSGRKIKRP